MPNPASKSRQALKARFVRNAIPSQKDFADLIDASLSQADDGLIKLPDQPLALVRQKADQPLLRFYADPSAEGSAWQLQLTPGDKPGFGLSGADGKLALQVDGVTGDLRLEGALRLKPSKEIVYDSGTDDFKITSNDGRHRLLFRSAANKLELQEFGDIILSSGAKNYAETGTMVIHANGNVGIGTSTAEPRNRLTVQTIHNQSKDPDSGMSYGGAIAIKSNCPQIDFIDTENNDWSIYVDSGKLYFVRQPWIVTDLVLDGTGRIGMGIDSPNSKLHLLETTGTPAGPNAGSLLLDHDDSGGASSIVFRSKVNRGSDYAFIEYRDNNSAARAFNPGVVEDGLLTIGIQNDLGDHIALMATGNVGVGTTTPEAKLHVNGNTKITGDASVGGRLDLNGNLSVSGANQEIVFADNGQIRSADNNHRLIFRRPENKLELREYGDIVLSSGSRDGSETAKLVLLANGNLGIGLGVGVAPSSRLHLQEATGTPAGLNAGSLLLDHDDSGGASSIVFRSKVNRGSDYAFIEYRDNNSAARAFNPGVVEDGLLTIGIRDEVGDHIALMATGNVGVGTTTPAFKLEVNGSTRITRNACPKEENSFNLEIFSPNTSNNDLYTKIRFHQNGQYWGWLGYHGIGGGIGEFAFWDLNATDARLRAGDIIAKGVVARKIWAVTGNGPVENADIGRLSSRTLRVYKLFADTVLRITYCDNFRISGDDVACRWEIRIDGNSVSPPILIDRYESSGNRHIHGTVMGYASGVGAGSHEIQVWIMGHPHNGLAAKDACTGWNASTWTLDAEEVWLA